MRLGTQKALLGRLLSPKAISRRAGAGRTALTVVPVFVDSISRLPPKGRNRSCILLIFATELPEWRMAMNVAKRLLDDPEQCNFSILSQPSDLVGNFDLNANTATILKPLGVLPNRRRRLCRKQLYSLTHTADRTLYAKPLFARPYAIFWKRAFLREAGPFWAGKGSVWSSK